MTTNRIFNNENVLPDMNAIAQSIKTIRRAVPATQDGAYTYFADDINIASTIADTLESQVNDALIKLPISIKKLKSAEAFTLGIEKINNAEKAGEIDAKTADAGRQQLESRLTESVSSVIIDFTNSANDLSETARRLSKNSDKVDIRRKDAVATETSNFDRATSDFKRENARVDTLQATLDKLNNAVDESRGGPTEDLVSLIPDEKELSSLLDVGAEDAAAPEVAAAKKAVELAVAEMKKVLAVVDKTIEFIHLTELRDQVFDALQAQRKISNAAAERVRVASNTLGVLGTIAIAGVAMGTASDEVQKMVSAFSNFTREVKNLDGKEITEATISPLCNPMDSYLAQLSIAHNNVILS